MPTDRLYRLEELTCRHLDGQLGADEVRELASLLADDPGARRTFARAVAYDTALPQVARRAWYRRWPAALAAAAALVLAAGLWWAVAEPDGPRLQPGSDAVVLRGGRELAADRAGALRRDDEVRARTGGVELLWPAEGTRAQLAAGGSLAIAEPGPRKQLVLRQGRLAVEAAPQQARGGLVVRADRLAVTVVGTRFQVVNGDGGSSVAVEHGAVAVDAGGVRRTVAAGQVAVAGRQGPVWIGDGEGALLQSRTGAQLDAAAWDAVQGRGWIGLRGADGVAARVEATAERIENPELPEGYARLLPDLAIRADVTLARPATLAIFLICRRPDGRDWVGNYTVQEKLPAGRSQRTWMLGDCRTESGKPLADAIGARMVKVAVCAWNQPAGLIVHRVAVGNAGAAALKP